MLRGCLPGVDPGPCPVDDAPHTTCTSPDYTGRAVVAVAVRRPAALNSPLVRDLAPIMTPADAALAPGAESFTSKDYRRATHGRRLRAARKKGATHARD